MWQVFSTEDPYVIGVRPPFSRYMAGFVLLLLSLAAFWGILYVYEHRSALPFGGVTAILAGCGLFLGVLALRLLRGRRVTLDRRKGVVRICEPHYLTRGSVEEKLSAFHLVSVTRELVGSSFGSSTRREQYPVALGRVEVGQPLRVMVSSHPMVARSIGERLAKHTHLPLSDSSSGATVVRDADELDLPVGRRLQKKGLPDPGVIPPRRATVATEGSQVTIRFGRVGFQLESVVLLLVMGVLAISLFSVRSSTPVMVLGFLFLCLVLMVTRRERVTVNRKDLTRTIVFAGFGLTVRIPLSELEEFELIDKDARKLLGDAVAGSKGTKVGGVKKKVQPWRGIREGISARSDRRSIRIGKTQHLEDIVHAYLVLARKIAA